MPTPLLGVHLFYAPFLPHNLHSLNFQLCILFSLHLHSHAFLHDGGVHGGDDVRDCGHGHNCMFHGRGGDDVRDSYSLSSNFKYTHLSYEYLFICSYNHIFLLLSRFTVIIPNFIYMYCHKNYVKITNQLKNTRNSR